MDQYWSTLVSLVLYPAYLFTTCLFLSLWLWLWLLFFSLPSFYLLRLFLFHLLSLTCFAFSLTPFLLIQFNFEDIEWKYSQCSRFMEEVIFLSLIRQDIETQYQKYVPSFLEAWVERQEASLANVELMILSRVIRSQNKLELWAFKKTAA